MKKNTTELVFILDKSGSMHGLETDTIGGFNSTVDEQKKLEGDVLVTTVLFSNASETVHDRVDISKIAPMTEKDYRVGGCTALLDAIGDAVHHIKNIHKYARPGDVPEHTMFVITTDGMENASRRYSSGDIKKLIGKQKKHGWEFLFIGANIDAVETARCYGISEDRAVNYHAEKKGTAVVFEAVSAAVGSVRSSAPLAPCWSKEINDDYNSRKH